MRNVEIIIISFLCALHILFVISVLLIRLPRKEMEIHQTKIALITLCAEIIVVAGMMLISFFLAEDEKSKQITQIESVCVSALLLTFSFLLFSDWAYIKNGVLCRHIAFFNKKIPLNSNTIVGVPVRFVRIVYKTKSVILSNSYSNGNFASFYQKINDVCGLY